MAKILKGNFSADGESSVVLTSDFVVQVGTDVANDFGGGTVDVLISSDNIEFTKFASLTAEGMSTGRDISGMGFNVKIKLSGATSPDLNYVIKYTQ